MKRLTLILTALSAVALSSCDNRLAVPVSGRIDFQVVQKATKTVVGYKFTGDSFGTYAYGSNGDTRFMDNEKVVPVGDCWSTVQEYYWPKFSTLDFFSYYPYDPTDTIPSVCHSSISYTNYEVCGVDLMYSSLACRFSGNVDLVNDNADGGVESAYSGVPTVFHHALAKISIQVQVPFLESPDGRYEWSISCSNPKICGLKNKGSLYLYINDLSKAGIIEWVTPSVWSNAGGNIDVPLEMPVISEVGKNYLLLSDYFVLPQMLSEQCISMDCVIDCTKDGVPYWHEEETVKAPLATSELDRWPINANILYTLYLSPANASEEKPDEPLEITMDPAEIPWDKVTVNN